MGDELFFFFTAQAAFSGHSRLLLLSTETRPTPHRLLLSVFWRKSARFVTTQAEELRHGRRALAGAGVVAHTSFKLKLCKMILLSC